jgi:hypothetical protein
MGSDKASKDLARVLRVPGTHNHKYDPPRPVALLRFTDTRRAGLRRLSGPDRGWHHDVIGSLPYAGPRCLY